MGFTRRFRIRKDRREFQKLAVERRLRLGPKFFHGTQVFARNRPAPREIDTHDCGFLRLPSCADPKQETAAREIVDSRNLLRERQRMALRNETYCRSELQ